MESFGRLTLNKWRQFEAVDIDLLLSRTLFPRLVLGLDRDVS